VREVPVPGAVRDTSFFLISYPHTERNGQGSEWEPDDGVIKFYGDLCRNVEELAAVPPRTRVGVGDLRERSEGLLADGVAAHPELLIIDPWAVTRQECQRLLARFNLADKPWVQVVIPWNPADGETAAAESRLRLALDSALRFKLERGRVTSAIAAEGVPSLSAFCAVLPLLIPAAGKSYLRHAPTFPPDGSVVEKPTLHGFRPDPPNPLERTGDA